MSARPSVCYTGSMRTTPLLILLVLVACDAAPAPAPAPPHQDAGAAGSPAAPDSDAGPAQDPDAGDFRQTKAYKDAYRYWTTHQRRWM
jgi:hypothetical protein